MKYCFDLDNDENDKFDVLADNVGTLIVMDEEGEVVTSEYRVMLTLNRNGLIGLGTELIRMAHEFKLGRHSHIEPMMEGYVAQHMGIFLTPESKELIIACGNETDVDSYIPPELQE